MDLDLKASDLLADLFSGVADDDGELQAMLAALNLGNPSRARLLSRRRHCPRSYLTTRLTWWVR